MCVAPLGDCYGGDGAAQQRLSSPTKWLPRAPAAEEAPLCMQSREQFVEAPPVTSLSPPVASPSRTGAWRRWQMALSRMESARSPTSGGGRADEVAPSPPRRLF